MRTSARRTHRSRLVWLLTVDARPARPEPVGGADAGPVREPADDAVVLVRLRADS